MSAAHFDAELCPGPDVPDRWPLSWRRPRQGTTQSHSPPSWAPQGTWAPENCPDCRLGEINLIWNLLKGHPNISFHKISHFFNVFLTPGHRFLPGRSLRFDWTCLPKPVNNNLELLPSGKFPWEFFNAVFICIAPANFVKIFRFMPPGHYLDRFGRWESRPWRHRKWDFNMTNGKICLAPELCKPLVRLKLPETCF